jgi:protease-4
METSDIHDLLGRVGIKLDTIKSGKYKDIGSYSRPMTPAERALLQGLSDDIYDQFVSDVSEGRKKVLTKDQVRGLADGRVYTGRQALKVKLVDELGTLEQALDSAARDAGIKGEFRVTEYERDRGVFDTLFGSSETSLPGGARRWALLGEFVRKLLRAKDLTEIR